MTARAPRTASRAEQEGTRKFFRLRVKDQTLDIVPNLTLDEAFVVRGSTPGNLAFETFLTHFGMDSVFVLWWVGRRQNGDAKLAFKDAQREWEKDYAPLKEDEFDLTEVDLDGEPMEGENPEGPGPDSSSPGPTSPTSSASPPSTSVTSPSLSSTAT